MLPDSFSTVYVALTESTLDCTIFFFFYLSFSFYFHFTHVYIYIHTHITHLSTCCTCCEQSRGTPVVTLTENRLSSSSLPLTRMILSLFFRATSTPHAKKTNSKTKKKRNRVRCSIRLKMQLNAVSACAMLTGSNG